MKIFVVFIAILTVSSVISIENAFAEEEILILVENDVRKVYYTGENIASTFFDPKSTSVIFETGENAKLDVKAPQVYKYGGQLFILRNGEEVIPKNVKGVITVQFDNLDDNSLARVGLPIVVDRVETSSEIIIPDWVRNNAKWWSAAQIKDNDFASGIEFMIKEGIITVPSTSNGQSSGNSVIPDWVRNNAGWWSDRLISDKEFANGLQYLIENGIISV